MMDDVVAQETAIGYISYRQTAAASQQQTTATVAEQVIHLIPFHPYLWIYIYATNKVICHWKLGDINAAAAAHIGILRHLLYAEQCLGSW